MCTKLLFKRNGIFLTFVNLFVVFFRAGANFATIKNKAEFFLF